MPFLRNAHRITRFVLVWFALSLGVAIASPLVRPQGMQLICSAAGTVKVIATGDASNAEAGNPATTLASHTLDCPLCAGVAAPPPPLAVVATTSMALRYALPAPIAHPFAAPAGAPLPARGPPDLA